MNYTIFADKYPNIDLFLKIFQGIMPTLIALLAIHMNNKKANRREGNKIIVDMRLKTLLLLQNQIAELESLVYSTGKKFLEYMHYLGELDEKEYFNDYSAENYKMLMFSRKILFCTNMEMAKIHIKEIKFDKCFNKINEYSQEIFNLMDEYNKRAICTPKAKQNDLLDYIQQQLITVSEAVEEELLDYAERLSNNILNIKVY
ncbi:hypothetical protein ADU86_03920 [Clostridium botulinum]|uniref:hypothetical protein n=1 Tax=Clostridium botulinum TaxID=1491 RepID=UPI0006A54B52|nr:hypothetical protein [Clostridium botulinum]KOC47753.1 hypothetical protein ADU86_03920 [Clostridium botulinum]